MGLLDLFGLGKDVAELTLKHSAAGNVTGVKLPPPPVFAIVDHGTKPTPNLGAIAGALTRQVNEHAGSFRPYGWGFAADVIVVRAGAMLPPDAIEIGLFDHPDQAGVLGYHDVGPRGVPVVKVFPLLDAQSGCSVSSTLSHEIMETLGNPDGNACAQDWSTGKIWAYENCDAVEETYYRIDGVEVSNFVLPHYFAPPQDRSKARYDFLGQVKAPFALLSGGYSQHWDGHGWVEVNAFAPGKGRRPSFALAKEGGYSRMRRALKTARG